MACSKRFCREPNSIQRKLLSTSNTFETIFFKDHDFFDDGEFNIRFNALSMPIIQQPTIPKLIAMSWCNIQQGQHFHENLNQMQFSQPDIPGKLRILKFV